ncbi:hypothetical protein GH714_002298 [Hevea brasiliensis]|uniref:Uncharacterized protein n=1 Tax=Hevea brasiliensis TaxID=3981 RepID=A0A6A6LJ67_HEVBR|nr:hypothetical protein GH714_002298 [Hevea brasiliensis]
MAILSPATAARSAHPPPQAFPKLNAKNFQSPSLIPINSQFQFLSLRSNSNAHPRRLHAALSPQPAPQSDPPPEKDPVRPGGIFGTLSGLQDRVQIFLAVSGCLYSSGLLHGMEGTMVAVDQTRDLDLEDDIYLLGDWDQDLVTFVGSPTEAKPDLKLKLPTLEWVQTSVSGRVFELA